MEIRTSLHVFERKSFISAYFIGLGVNFLEAQIVAYVVHHTLHCETYSYYNLNQQMPTIVFYLQKYYKSH